jgi:hypothetical protein
VKRLAELKIAPGEVVFLDRVEGDVATLLLGPDGSDEANVSRKELPRKVREGDRLRMGTSGRLRVDREATRAGQAAVADLMAELLRPSPSSSQSPQAAPEPEGSEAAKAVPQPETAQSAPATPPADAPPATRDGPKKASSDS